MDLGIDLGTSRTVICSEEGGVLLDEATAIALGRGDEVIACGDDQRASQSLFLFFKISSQLRALP